MDFLAQPIKLLTFLLLAFASPILFAQVDVEQLEEEAITKAVEKVAPSVIRFETIGGSSRVEGAVVGSGPSTGLAVTKDGFVVSASFHFAHDPASILATLPNGKKVAAEIVGRDTTRKIVLLKVDSDFEFNVPKTIDISKVQVGQTVIAVGRVFDPATTNVSTGIISAKNRIWGKAIQTDAKISPANFGGPLTNLSGKVIGILVPMSPQGTAEMAGTEWYDSGIGFAVPVSTIMKNLEALKSGKTLRAGLLGVSMKGTDVYADPAVVAFCNGNSPAAKSGIRLGDEIVRINDQKISRQAEMKHALGPLYEGDQIEIEVKRSEEALTFSVELVGEIEPFDPPAIGVLLDSNSTKVVIEQLVPDSNADKAGLTVGDTITKAGDTELKEPSQFKDIIKSAEIGSQLELAITSETGEQRSVQVVVGSQNAEPLDPVVENSDTQKLQTLSIKVADAANKCFAIVPKTLDGEPKPALMVWIPAPGKLQKKRIEKQWVEICKKQHAIVLIPESTNAKQWRPDDLEFISSAIENLAKKHSFNKSQVTIGGSKSGGTMASLVAFKKRSIFRGLAILDANISVRIGPVSTSPVEPLLILLGTNTKIDEQGQATIKQLESAKFPLSVQEKKQAQSKWLEVFLRWSTTVDRI